MGARGRLQERLQVAAGADLNHMAGRTGWEGLRSTLRLGPVLGPSHAPHPTLLCRPSPARCFAAPPLQEAGAALILAAKRKAPESGRRLIDAFLALHNQLVKLCPWQPPTVRLWGEGW
jgi:hypothetical protein